MNIVRMILKEAGGRAENAAGSINSKDNMFAGSSGNAVSDKVGKMFGQSGNQNPIADPNEKEGDTNTTSFSAGEETTPSTTSTENETQVEHPEGETVDFSDTDTETFSDETLKNYEQYKKNAPKAESNKGKLKNLDISPTSTKPVTSGDSGSGSGGIGAMANMFQGMMNAQGGEGASDMGGDSADMASDMGDMGDMADAGDAADAASDERLKHIFGDNQDAIKAFAKINAIEFTYNDKAKEIPDGENKGIDDDVHYGVKAQEIAENPFTESAVKKDPISDYLTIDIKELTTANTAIISEICKRILVIEKVLGIKVV